jgi:hypothetical protein
VRRRPEARREGILSEELDGELLLYDVSTNVAHALAPVAATVWRSCDGAALLERIAASTDLALETVALAVAQLAERGLLVDPPTLELGSPESVGPTRREAVTRVARTGGAAFGAALIASVAVGPALAAASTTCSPGYTQCAGNCIDTNTDVNNCGACGTVCPAAINGTAQCDDGTCGIECNTGYTLCGGQCVSLQNDPNNCGTCFKTCASGTCVGGVCGE